MLRLNVIKENINAFFIVLLYPLKRHFYYISTGIEGSHHANMSV